MHVIFIVVLLQYVPALHNNNKTFNSLIGLDRVRREGLLRLNLFYEPPNTNHRTLQERPPSNN